MKYFHTFYLFLIALLVISCANKEQRTWKKATEQNTIQSFTDFINEFPQNKALIDTAHIKIDQIITSFIDSSLWYIVESKKYGENNTKEKKACFAKAATFLETVIDYDSLNSIALNNLAVLNFLLDKFELSADLFERAAKLENADSTQTVWLEVSAPLPSAFNDRTSSNFTMMYFCQPLNGKPGLLEKLDIHSSKAYLLVPGYGIVARKTADKNQDSFEAMLNPKFDESIKGYKVEHFIRLNIKALK